MLIIHAAIYTITDLSTSASLSNVDCEGGGRYCHLAVSDPSLILYMPFDVNDNLTGSTVYDWSNYNQDGIIVGAVWNSSGKYGSSLSFDGINNYVRISDDPSLSILQKTTLSAWIYPTEYGDASDSYIKNIYSDEDVDLTAVWRLGSQGNASLKDRFGVNFNNGANNDIESTGAIPLNTWTHVITVTNGTNILFYFNGFLDSSKSYSITPTQKSLPWMIGTKAESGSTSRQYKGSIDEVMIFNRSLNSSEISQIYNQQFPRFYSSGVHDLNTTISSGNNSINITTSNFNQNSTNLSLKLSQASGVTNLQNVSSTAKSFIIDSVSKILYS